jgi:hypothetical protein
VQPPGLVDGLVADPVLVGPFAIGEIAASIAPPFGGGSGKGLPGGGSIVRLPGNGGYGGTLQLPLGPAQVSAAAVLSMRDGSPSFLAVLGITFLPPVQLSFGFSLDRVGGIIGLDRTADTEALRAAVRTGAAGDVLFAARPPSSPLALVTAADRLFPVHRGTHLVGPSLKVSWLSFGPTGSLLSLDLAVVVEIPTGRVVVLGVARGRIPGLPGVLELRLDLLGIVDPRRVIGLHRREPRRQSRARGLRGLRRRRDAVLLGDARLHRRLGRRLLPGVQPGAGPAAGLRRVGMALDVPLPILSVRAEGYFAGHVQQRAVRRAARDRHLARAGGARFVQLDAIVVFRPFRFEARVSAGFDVSVAGFSFGGVRLDGTISGPGPVVIRGSLTIETFLFDISWDETFTLGSGPSDTLPTPPRLLEVIRAELDDPANLHAESVSDPDVVLAPRPGRPGSRPCRRPGPCVSSSAARRWDAGGARRRPSARRPAGRPCHHAGPRRHGAVQPGQLRRPDRCRGAEPSTLRCAECRPGALADRPGPLGVPERPDDRRVKQIVISDGQVRPTGGAPGALLDLHEMALLREASRRPPAVSDISPMLTARPETWMAWTPVALHGFSSASAAHQFARHHDTVAVTEPDFESPVSLEGCSSGGDLLLAVRACTPRDSHGVGGRRRLQGAVPVALADLADATDVRSGTAAFELFGPGDVERLAAGTITRRFPAPGAGDAEETKLALVEFGPRTCPGATRRRQRPAGRSVRGWCSS